MGRGPTSRGPESRGPTSRGPVGRAPVGRGASAPAHRESARENFVGRGLIATVRPPNAPAARPPRAGARELERAAPPLEPGQPRVGGWLFATRPGAEQDLADELHILDARGVLRRVTEGLVTLTNEKFKLRDERELAFARQGFPIASLLKPEASIAALQILTLLRTAAKGRLRVWAFDLWVPDGDTSNPLAARATKLEAEIIKELDRLAPDWAAERRANAAEARNEHGFYAQACLYGVDKLALGVLPARDAISLAPGGRLRMSVPEGAPSRAATKLLEAFVWIGREPDPNDLCVDLGAAPGGWTFVLAEKRARVLAVDMGKLAPNLRDRHGVYHLERDAFSFEPDEPVDWLFADLAFRPLDTAGLFCRWARRGWARFLVANIKLPMTQKAHHVERVREMLLDAGWSSLKIKQLYHDREEVTIAAVCLPKH